MKKLIPFILTLIMSSPGYAQTQNEKTQLPNVFPASPKASEFLKYTEVPVSKYTGVPNISIPVYTIKANGLDIPVGLSYHSNGFKVSEEAGWTGLGWSLSAGGSIVQIVKGYDDFGVFQNRNNEYQAIFNATNLTADFNCKRFNVYITSAGVQAPTPSEIPEIIHFSSDGRIIAGTRDVEPDVFKFNMPGYSGEFILDWATGLFKCITDRNIKVEGSGPGAFVIKTPDGNVFVFNNVEETKISGVLYENTISHPAAQENLIGERSSTTSQLTSIITSAGDNITFNYLSPTALLENLPSISYSSQTYTIPAIPNPGAGATPADEDFTTINYSRQSFNYLSSIEFPAGKLVFSSTNDRLDCIGTRKLNKIELKDDADNVIRSFDLNYSYFIGHSLGGNSDQWLNKPGYNTGKAASEITHRLKLLNVKESGKPAYFFEYNENLLPKKTSYAIDHWGIYNASLSKGSYLPDIKGVMDLAYANSAQVNSIIGSDRHSNADAAQAAVLKKITYPTGGYSTFGYELNAFDNYIPQDKVTSAASPEILLKDQNNSPDLRAKIFSSTGRSSVSLRHLNLSTYGSGSISEIGPNTYIRLTAIKKTTTNNNLIFNTPATFWSIYNSTAFGMLGTQINNVVSDTKILRLEFITTTQSYETFKLLENYYIEMDPDNIYILEAHLPDNAGPQGNSSSGPQSVAATYLTHFTDYDTIHYDKTYGAGLRVKSIEMKEDAGGILIKDFTYENGKLMSPVLYLKTSFLDIMNSIPGNNGYDHNYRNKNVISSASFQPTSTNASGKYVGYDMVTENNAVMINGNKVLNENGMLTELYTNQPDNTHFPPITTTGSYLFVYPSVMNPIQNGLVASVIIKNKAGNILRTTTNQYQVSPYGTPNCSFGRLSAYAGNRQGGQEGQAPESFYSVGFYPITSTKTLLTSTQTIEYLGGNSLTTVQLNDYDNYDQLVRTRSVDSKGDTLYSSLKYPYNFETGYTAMNNAGIITPVVEEKSVRVDRPVSLLKNHYETISGGPALAYINRKVSSSSGNAPLEDKVFFDLYGGITRKDKFKLLQYHDISGVYTTVLWGYNGQYPVAKIFGSDFNTSSQHITQAILDNPASDLQLKTELNKLRTGFAGSKVLVTTYTYKPLVGVISETGPEGRTTTYEYDEFQRLKLIRDKDLKILKAFEYKYQEPLDPCAANWQNTVTAIRCQVDISNQLTGMQEQEQIDLNTCSATYNQTRWKTVGANTTVCPIPVAMAELRYYNKIYNTVFLIMTHSNGTVYYFSLPPTSSTTIPSIIGQVPVGTYSVKMVPSDGLSHIFSIYTVVQTGVTQFNANVNLCTTCGFIEIR